MCLHAHLFWEWYARDCVAEAGLCVSMPITGRRCRVQAGASQRRELLISAAHKGLVIVAAALVSRCAHWRSLLPPPLLRIAPPGALCALFWPPPGCELHLPRAAAAGDSPGGTLKAGAWWRALTASTILQGSRAVLRHVTMAVVRHSPLSPAGADVRRSLDETGSTAFKFAQETAAKGAPCTTAPHIVIV